jgi:hypothetical protein
VSSSRKQLAIIHVANADIQTTTWYVFMVKQNGRNRGRALPACLMGEDNWHLIRLLDMAGTFNGNIITLVSCS